MMWVGRKKKKKRHDLGNTPILTIPVSQLQSVSGENYKTYSDL